MEAINLANMAKQTMRSPEERPPAPKKRLETWLRVLDVLYKSTLTVKVVTEVLPTFIDFFNQWPT